MKKKKTKILIYSLIAIIACLILIYCYQKIFNYYKIEDRTTDLKKFKNVDGAKANSWIRVQGTNIDLPVLYYNNIEDVSNPTYDIAWSFTNDKKIADKTTILSHNVLNVSKKPLIGNKNHKRFEQLMGYVYYDFVKENKYIQYTIDGENYLYKIYGVSFQKTKNIDFEKNKFSKQELKKYIENTQKNSYYKFNVKVDENDKLLTLVTCTRFFGSNKNYSFVVDARKLRNNESVNNYRVVEKDNYKEIKKIMEGVNEYE